MSWIIFGCQIRIQNKFNLSYPVNEFHLAGTIYISTLKEHLEYLLFILVFLFLFPNDKLIVKILYCLQFAFTFHYLPFDQPLLGHYAFIHNMISNLNQHAQFAIQSTTHDILQRLILLLENRILQSNHYLLFNRQLR